MDEFNLYFIGLEDIGFKLALLYSIIFINRFIRRFDVINENVMLKAGKLPGNLNYFHPFSFQVM